MEYKNEYKNDLKWQTELARFDPAEQRVLLALSHDRYRWRTRERLLTVTGLNEHDLDSTLARLMDKDVVRPSFSKAKHVIYGLKERVG